VQAVDLKQKEYRIICTILILNKIASALSEVNFVFRLVLKIEKSDY